MYVKVFIIEYYIVAEKLKIIYILIDQIYSMVFSNWSYVSARHGENIDDITLFERGDNQITYTCDHNCVRVCKGV